MAIIEAVAQRLTARSDYPLGFTAAALRPDLARILAEVFLECGDWQSARTVVLERNLFQARSRTGAERTEIELRQRLQTLTPSQLMLLASTPADGRRALAWLAVLKAIPFALHFASDTLRTKLEQQDTILRPSDYEAFVQAEALSHPEVLALADSTRERLRQMLMRMLTDAGILELAGAQRRIARPVIPPDVLETIVADDPQWLAGFLVPDTEIREVDRYG